MAGAQHDPVLDERTEAAATAVSPSRAVPALIEASGEDAARRFIEFFTVTIRNPNTRAAYGRAVRDFCDWCADNGHAPARSRSSRCMSAPMSSF